MNTPHNPRYVKWQDDPVTREIILDLAEYASHSAWRCEYRTRYKKCVCGLDDLMARIGLPAVPVADPGEYDKESAA